MSDDGGGMSDMGEPEDFNYDEEQPEIIDNENNIDVHPLGTEPQAIPKDQRMSTPYMTKYEKARILGTRALQISTQTST